MKIILILRWLILALSDIDCPLSTSNFLSLSRGDTINSSSHILDPYIHSPSPSNQIWVSQELAQPKETNKTKFRILQNHRIIPKTQDNIENIAATKTEM